MSIFFESPKMVVQAPSAVDEVKAVAKSVYTGLKFGAISGVGIAIAYNPNVIAASALGGLAIASLLTEPEKKTDSTLLGDCFRGFGGGFIGGAVGVVIVINKAISDTKSVIASVTSKVTQIQGSISTLASDTIAGASSMASQAAESASTFASDTITEAASKAAELAESFSALANDAIAAAKPNLNELAESASTFANETITAAKPIIINLGESLGLENKPWVILAPGAAILAGGIATRAAAGTAALLAKGSSTIFHSVGMTHLGEDFDNFGTKMGNIATESMLPELELSVNATVISAAAYIGYNATQ